TTQLTKIRRCNAHTAGRKDRVTAHYFSELANARVLSVALFCRDPAPRVYLSRSQTPISRITSTRRPLAALSYRIPHNKIHIRAGLGFNVELVGEKRLTQTN